MDVYHELLHPTGRLSVVIIQFEGFSLINQSRGNQQVAP